MYKTEDELVNETIKSLEKMYKQATKIYSLKMSEKQQQLINKFDHAVKVGEHVSTADCIEIIKLCGSIELVFRQQFAKKTRITKKSKPKKKK